MPIPFIAGVAIGAGLVVAYNKRDDIKSKFSGAVEKGKDLACSVKNKECDDEKDSEVEEVKSESKTVATKKPTTSKTTKTSTTKTAAKKEDN